MVKSRMLEPLPLIEQEILVLFFFLFYIFLSFPAYLAASRIVAGDLSNSVLTPNRVSSYVVQ